MAQGSPERSKLKVFSDLDGTLLDVSERNHQVYSVVTQQFGGTPMPKSQYWELKREKTKWPKLFELSGGLLPDIQSDYLNAFIPLIEDQKYLKLDTPFPDALATMATLATRFGVENLYLVSLRRNATNLEEELKWLKLREHFGKVLSGHSENDGYDKKIELIKNELGDAEGVIIGDTEADIVTGKELGMTTIAVTSGIRSARFLESIKTEKFPEGIRPDYTVEHIGQVLDLPIFVDYAA